MMGMKKIGRSLYEISMEKGMRVPAYAFIDDTMAESSETRQALEQIKNVAWLPGVQQFLSLIHI